VQSQAPQLARSAMEAEIMHGQEISLGQFVEQLTGLLQKDSVQLPFKNQRPWHILFYDLKKITAAGRPKFFDQLRFDWDGPYPKCRELSEFLHALHVTTSIGVANPDYDEILVGREVEEEWVNNAKKDEPDLKQFVDYAVTRAKKEFAGALVEH
jgi:hypothetical protein